MRISQHPKSRGIHEITVPVEYLLEGQRIAEIEPLCELLVAQLAVGRVTRRYVHVRRARFVIRCACGGCGTHSTRQNLAAASERWYTGTQEDLRCPESCPPAFPCGFPPW